MNTIKYAQWNNSKLQKSAPFREVLLNSINSLEREEIVKILVAEKFCEKMGLLINQVKSFDNLDLLDIRDRILLQTQGNQHICFTRDLLLAYLAYINKEYDNCLNLLKNNKENSQYLIENGFHYYDLRQIIVCMNQFQILFSLNDRDGYLQIEEEILQKLGISQTSQKEVKYQVNMLDKNGLFLYAFCICDSIFKIIGNYNNRLEISRFAKQIHIQVESHSNKVFSDLYSLINILKQISHIDREEFSYLSKKHLTLSSKHFGGILDTILVRLNQERYW